MWNSRSYQLVSEHSILSAQSKTKVAATEEFLEKRALQSRPEWKEELDKIKQQLQQRTKDDGGCRWWRDHAPCDELSETEFEIYLEMKLQWLQQFYVTASSTKSEKKSKESEEEGWNEEIVIDSKFRKLVVVANHQSQKKEEEPEIEKAGNREGCSINEPVTAIVKPEKGDGGDAKSPPEKSPSETPHSDVVVVEELPLKALGEISLA